MFVEPKVSIVMPVYNGEDYLAECLANVKAQSFEDFELICVNDGSNDGSKEILQNASVGDKRIRVINQRNLGASAARNRGLAEAHGDYLLFFDDDDLMESSMLKKLVERMEETNADICVTSGYKLDMRTGDRTKVKGFLRMDRVPEKAVFAPEDLGKYLLNFASFHICNKMYRMDFVRKNGIEFTQQRVAEDAIFFVEALLSAQCISVVDDQLFTYRKHAGGSVSDSVSSSDILEGFRMSCTIKHLLCKKEMYHEPFKQSCINRALVSVMHYRNVAMNYSAFVAWYEYLVEKGVVELDLADHEEEYFYSARMAKQLELLLKSDSASDYLFALYKESRFRSERLQAKNTQLKRRVAAQKRMLGRMSASDAHKTEKPILEMKKTLASIAKKLKR